MLMTMMTLAAQCVNAPSLGLTGMLGTMTEGIQEPCQDCADAQRQLAIIAAVVGAVLGAGVAFVVLKNG